MKTFEFRVTQEAKGFYESDIKIGAKTEEEAIKIVTSLSENSIENLCSRWSLNHEFEAVGNFEVWDENCNQIV